MSRIKTGTVEQPLDYEQIPVGVEYLPGEIAGLLQRIGVPSPLTEPKSSDFLAPGIINEDALRDFLGNYVTLLLARWEMPVIARARYHAERGHARELIALDGELAGQPIPAFFASASRRIGRARLERLRPLREERTVRKYLEAVETGHAAGWHTVVYGLTLAIYSLPLRHGLLNYARLTLSELARAAARPAGISESACVEILETVFPRLPEIVEQTVASCATAVC